jgi:hypothetical protein
MPARVLEQPPEPIGVEPLGVDGHGVPRRPGHEQVAVARSCELLAQPGDVHLDALGGRGGRLGHPQLVDDPLHRNDVTGVDEKQRQERALLRTAERHGAPVNADLERPQEPELRRLRHRRHRRRPTILTRTVPL